MLSLDHHFFGPQGVFFEKSKNFKKDPLHAKKRVFSQFFPQNLKKQRSLVNSLIFFSKKYVFRAIRGSFFEKSKKKSKKDPLLAEKHIFQKKSPKILNKQESQFNNLKKWLKIVKNKGLKVIFLIFQKRPPMGQKSFFL